MSNTATALSRHPSLSTIEPNMLIKIQGNSYQNGHNGDWEAGHTSLYLVVAVLDEGVAATNLSNTYNLHKETHIGYSTRPLRTIMSLYQWKDYGGVALDWDTLAWANDKGELPCRVYLDDPFVASELRLLHERIRSLTRVLSHYTELVGVAMSHVNSPNSPK